MATRVWVDFQGPLFTLRSPSDWYVTSTPDIQAMFIEPNRGQEIRANVIISLRPVQENVTVDGVLGSAQEQQRAQYPEFNLVAQEEVQAGEGVGKYQMYTWVNPENGVPVLQAQAFFIVNNLLFTLTATCDQREQEEATPVFNEMFGSLRISAPPAPAN